MCNRKSNCNFHHHTDSSISGSDWLPLTPLQPTQGILRWFCQTGPKLSIWLGSSRTGSGSRPPDWRFSRGGCPQRRPACPQRAPWRSVASKEGQRKVLQRTLCTMTTNCCLQTVRSSTVITTSGQNQTLLPGGLDTVDKLHKSDRVFH